MTFSAAELEIIQRKLKVIAAHLFEVQSNIETLDMPNFFSAINAAHSCTELALAAIKAEVTKRGLQTLGVLDDVEAL